MNISNDLQSYSLRHCFSADIKAKTLHLFNKTLNDSGVPASSMFSPLTIDS